MPTRTGPDHIAFPTAPTSSDRAVRRSFAERAAAPFGVAATVTIIFNTVLAWTKDAFDSVNAFMASLTGHHWITHGIADVVLFLALGSVLTLIGHPRQVSERLTLGLATAAILAGGGLALWFVLF